MAKATKKVTKKAAPKKVADKRPVGRPKNIETPEIMWQLFQQYKKDTKSNPFIVKDWVGGVGKEVFREKKTIDTRGLFSMAI